MKYEVTKTYGHDLGLSACFRQCRANSHCRYLHGYALAFSLTFGCDQLDNDGWVIDFGSLKPVKEYLTNMFDHKLIVADNDPSLSTLIELDEQGLATVVLMPAVGCEAFAKEVFRWVERWLVMAVDGPECRVRLLSVECREHGANAARYIYE